MTRTFVIVREAVTIVTDLDNWLVELDKTSRRRFGRDDVDLALSEDGMKRILREDMLDVGDEQLLVLLLVMNAENDDRLEFCEKFLVHARQKIIDVLVDRRAIAMCFLDGRSRDQPAQIAPMHVPRGVVIRIKEI